jgi:hypothetical protein
MNERADELSKAGRTAEVSELCPGPPNYELFWLRITDMVCKHAKEYHKQIPRNSALNKIIFQQVVKVHILRAMKL